MKAVIFPRLRQGNALEIARRVCMELQRCEIEVWADPVCENSFSDLSFVHYAPFTAAARDADFAVAIGGDGTILHCAGRLVGARAKLLGINTGRLGFLAAMESNEIAEIERLKTGDYRVSKRMLLRGVLRGPNGEILREITALNDIVLACACAGANDFTVSRYGTVLGQYRADGIIFSTPTGSTAYALSAGGPIIEPEFACVEMALICPHAMAARPILFSPQTRLRVACSVRGNRTVELCADGEEIPYSPASQTLEISGSSQSIAMLDLSGNTFFDSLSRKLMQPLKERQL